jgi:hypothetical protein
VFTNALSDRTDASGHPRAIAAIAASIPTHDSSGQPGTGSDDFSLGYAFLSSNRFCTTLATHSGDSGRAAASSAPMAAMLSPVSSITCWSRSGSVCDLTEAYDSRSMTTFSNASRMAVFSGVPRAAASRISCWSRRRTRSAAASPAPVCVRMNSTMTCRSTLRLMSGRRS